MKSLWGQGERYLRIRQRYVEVSPKIARLILVGIVATIIVIFIGGDVGLYNLWIAQRRMERLELEVVKLERENTQLQFENELLMKDRFAIEKVAREKYGYLLPGESVYRIIMLPASGESETGKPSSLDSEE